MKFAVNGERQPYEFDYRTLESVPELPAAENPSPMQVRAVSSVC